MPACLTRAPLGPVAELIHAVHCSGSVAIAVLPRCLEDSLMAIACVCRAAWACR